MYVHLVSTRAGGVGFVLIIAAVIVAITKPPQRDAAVVLTFESVCRASVLVWMKKYTKENFKFSSSNVIYFQAYSINHWLYTV